MRSRGEDEAGGSASWIVLRHSPIEGLGLLGSVLRDRGIHHRTLDLAAGDTPPRDLEGVGGLIVLGGQSSLCHAGDGAMLRHGLSLVEQAIEAARPVLGICLGAQMIAQVLGARVYPGEHPEIGWGSVTLTNRAADDPVFLDHGPSLPVFHLHGDTYDLPIGAHHLARSDAYEQQAFEWSSSVYGLQFHLEFTQSIIDRLLADPDVRSYIGRATADPDRIADEAGARLAAMEDTARVIFGRYFECCGV